MFGFDRLSARSRTAQAFDFIGLVRLFALFGFQRHVRQENHASTLAGRDGEDFSFYSLKSNKWNSRTRQPEQGLSAFGSVRFCSALAAATGGAA